jgi:hypothetical protein
MNWSLPQFRQRGSQDNDLHNSDPQNNDLQNGDAQNNDARNLGAQGQILRNYNLAVPADPATSSEALTNSAPQRNPRIFHFATVLAGVVAAVLVSGAGGASAVWGKVSGLFSSRQDSRLVASAVPTESDLDRQKPQRQAEILLERAVSRSDGATGQIQARVARWQGKLQWDSQLSTLSTAALNSNDLQVRASAVEVELAAYGLAKSESNLDFLVAQSDSPDHARKIWALWTLGLMGNRGVQADRVVQVLALHLKDSDADSRAWAVEGLALVGTTPTLVPLLQAMHDDPSPQVRERAACSIAESGMLSPEQRRVAVPQLINYSEDPALDAQTRAWAFKALSDITGQRLPTDAAAWRNWYANN